MPERYLLIPPRLSRRKYKKRNANSEKGKGDESSAAGAFPIQRSRALACSPPAQMRSSAVKKRISRKATGGARTKGQSKYDPAKIRQLAGRIAKGEITARDAAEELGVSTANWSYLKNRYAKDIGGRPRRARKSQQRLISDDEPEDGISDVGMNERDFEEE